MSFNQVLNKSKKWTKKHSPEILTGFGIACFGASAVFAAVGTVKALDLIEEEKDRRLSEWPSSTITKEQEAELLHFAPRDYIYTCWKVYSPAVIAALIGTVCVVNANRINVKRTTALAAAYTLSETALREFREKAVEVIGEKKVEDIKQEITREKIEKIDTKDVKIIETGKGTTLMRESILTGAIFKSNIDEIQKVENEINLLLRTQDYCSINMYLDKLGLDELRSDISGLLGWNINRTGYLTIKRIPMLTSDGEPCISLEMEYLPEYEFDTYH